jgi:hypothetical protein
MKEPLAKFRIPQPIRSAIAAGIPSRVADFAALPSVALECMTSKRRRCVLTPATRRRLRGCAEIIRHRRNLIRVRAGSPYFFEASIRFSRLKLRHELF